MRWLLLLVPVLLICCVAASATPVSTQDQEPLKADDLEQFIDAFVTSELEKRQIPGAAVAVVKDGKILLTKGYGLANLERQTPFSADSTIFRIGSISKVFTAQAIVQLAESGRLDLHRDVNLYLKRLQVPATFAEPITARHLISHTSGLDEIRPGTQAPSQEELLPLDQFLNTRLVRLWKPGAIPMYSTYGITLAGALLEDVSDESFEQHLDRTIWTPLGMSRTCIEIPPPLAPDAAVGYELAEEGNQPARWEWYHTTPASSINSTAADMANWMIMHLQRGRWQQQRVLSEQGALSMQRTQASGHPGITGFAYGFEVQRYGDLELVMHGGMMAGFNSLVVLIPQRNLGLFVVSHHENSSLPNDLTHELLKRLLGPPASEPVPAPPDDFKARAHLFAGRYASIVYNHSNPPAERPGPVFQVEVLADGALRMNNRRWIEIEPLLFVCDDGGSRIAFRADETGRITHLFVGGMFVFERMP